MNAILYARFSPRPGADKSESIETQLERCRSYCDASEWTVSEPPHSDREASGARADNRPGLQRAIDRACRERAVLVCYSLSRLARNTADALEIATKLKKAGADLALLDIHLDTSTPMGKCMFTMIAAFSELEREQTAERTSDMMLAHQARGRRMGRRDRIPYGWRADPVDDKRLVKNVDEQRAIRRMIVLRSEGLGYREIGRVLIQEDSIMPRNGAPKWCYSTIRKVLKRAEAS